ncbi:coproporphyrinogen dehydrogenase HemZ [Cellulosilyticum ruminicola]|uniref:coproporphyrinogen dehydrogenase HemZ n=1 Tax=Cellulosilyticum ruminicola TaxID=425254 RepID=UPI0006D1AEE2|nr:coproporphyrinogen dehydrogenase HemZ [Cellulosilyticum ruminicola]
MIELKCVGHLAEYEITNVINLFEPYTNKDYKLEAIFDSPVATAILFEGDKEIFRAAFTVTVTEDELKNKKIMKQGLKKAVYKVLNLATGKEMPWGSLTGIRPTKLVHEQFKHNRSDEEIARYMQEEYFVTSGKCDMMIKVAKAEREILAKNKPEEVSLYIGIPFCPTRCVYCSFTAYSLKVKGNLVDAYLEALCKEITAVAQMKKDATIRSLYIGGGTPTSLNEQQLECLLKHVAASFDLSQIEEYTIEAGRPDTITKDKLRIMKEQGVSRISINPQSMRQKTLDVIGRAHSAEDIKRVFNEARELGHTEINMDMILGLPGETVEDVAYTLEELGKLGPENITVHTMAIKRASRLREELRESEGNVILTQGEVIQQMLNLCEEKMVQLGLEPYYMYRQKNMLGNFENVGYAKPGTECVYNIEIMEEKQSIML